MSEKDEMPDLVRKARMIETEGAETLWRNVIADTVMDLFESDGSVTKQSLRDELVKTMPDASTNRLLRAAYQGALKALDGNPPS